MFDIINSGLTYPWLFVVGIHMLTPI